MKALTEQTLVPVSFMALIIGGIYWVVSTITTVQAQIVQQGDQQNRQGAAAIESTRILHEISDRLARIEGKLGIEKK